VRSVGHGADRDLDTTSATALTSAAELAIAESKSLDDVVGDGDKRRPIVKQLSQAIGITLRVQVVDLGR